MKHKNTIAQRLIKGGFWATIGKITFTLGTIAWNALLTRLLSESEVGGFYIIASIVIVGETIVLGGLNKVVMRMISAEGSESQSTRKVIRGTSVLLILSALVSCFLYVLYVAPALGTHIFKSEIIDELAWFTAIWFILKATQTFLASILRGFHRISIAAFIDGAFTSIFISLALVVLWLLPKSADIREILFVVIGGLTTTVTFTLFLIRKSYVTTPA
jgi:O-antigen/teichoic acid export membrane protein